MNPWTLNFELSHVPKNVVLIHESYGYKQASLMDITLTYCMFVKQN